MRHAPLIKVSLGGMTMLIRGKRPGEVPVASSEMQHFTDYASHNEWGTDHYGFTYHGDLKAFCEEIRSKGATFVVEPWEFSPGVWLCYLSAPDSVSIELVQAK